MALTPGNAVFLDTNVLIYAGFPGMPFHGVARKRLEDLKSEGARFWTSRQVLREYLSATTRPGVILPQPSIAALSWAVRQFEAGFEIAAEDAAVTALLLGLLASRIVMGKQIHDANIAATMLRYGIPWLLTHNTNDFARYVPEIDILPLVP